MKLIGTLFLSITLFFAQSYTLTDVRKMYVDAAISKTNADKFFTFMDNYSKSNETLLAYKAAAYTLKAKHATGIKLKKEWFVKGVTILETVIKSNENNIEARVIRLSIQENTPKLLKYKDNMSADKKLILSHFSKQTPDLKEYIKSFVNQSNYFTKAEKLQLNK